MTTTTTAAPARGRTCRDRPAAGDGSSPGTWTMFLLVLPSIVLLLLINAFPLV